MKHFDRDWFALTFLIFPPLHRGGPIEASLTRSAAAEVAGFPPLHRGGPIEAHEASAMEMDLEVFPPLHRGGPIEAPSSLAGA